MLNELFFHAISVEILNSHVVCTSATSESKFRLIQLAKKSPEWTGT